MQIESISIPARDGFMLAGTCYQPAVNATQTVVVIHAATAVAQRFYKPFATYLAEQGYTAVTYDYRGTGGSRPASLRTFQALARDWVLLDMAGVIDHVGEAYRPQRQFHFGHSYGGQTIGLLPNGDRIDALVTLSAQSAYWRLQGGFQKFAVWFHVYFTIPLLSHLVGYMPWSWVGSAEDLPKGVALEWTKWCRRPRYLLDDPTLPLDRYERFKAPVLAYSFEDDDWGTRRSVDAMMGAYPNLTRRHVIPADSGLRTIGHFGFFRPKAAVLWQETIQWLEKVAPHSDSK